MLGKQKTSNVWQHFTLTTDKHEVYNHYKLKMSYCNSTGNPLKRIRAKHAFVDINQLSSIGSGRASGLNQHQSKQKQCLLRELQ